MQPDFLTLLVMSALGFAMIQVAAPPQPARDATVMDRGGHVLKRGDNGWARGRISPRLRETPPMCHEALRMEWADAYVDESGMLRLCHMLAGDEGANNMDPYVEGQTVDIQRSPS